MNTQKLAWIIGGVLTTLLLVAIVGFTSYQRGLELDQLNAELAKARASLQTCQKDATALNDKLANTQARIQELQKENQAAIQSHKSLEQEMRAALESRDVTISQLQGKLTVNILDRVLFDSGEAELKPEGSTVLRKVGAILAQHPNLKVHVIGHTDNIPIRGAMRSRFPTNWELSTARATAAVRFLTEKAGVDPRQLGAVGYGEFRPIAENSTPEGRARNRRIAITILSEEMAGSDAVASAQPAGSVSPAQPPVVAPAGPPQVAPPPIEPPEVLPPTNAAPPPASLQPSAAELSRPAED